VLGVVARRPREAPQGFFCLGSAVYSHDRKFIFEELLLAVEWVR
jgi:hypothetical protein